MEVFFYGLFMDHNILLKNGVIPSNPRTGYLSDFTLKIGTRASLIPSKGEKSYGILMTVDKSEIQNLYAEASVADYVPEEVNIMTNPHESIKAVCYNLPSELLTGTNTSYAKSLYELAKQKGFPNDYLGKIKKMTKTIA
nr:gamma-glutamylcyclotransferase family protein [uncultured Allomuricauda sp.]